jgi:glutaredoxin 2
MDKVLELDEDTLVVVDYKTSKYVSNPAELKSDIQLSMYDLVASIKFPEYKRIILALDYLRHDPVYTYRTPVERKKFAKYILAIHDEMVKLEERYAVPNLNDMCNWCDFKEHCDSYKNTLSEKSIFKKNLSDFSDEELVKEYLNIKSKSRILYNFEQELKSHIIERIESSQEDLTGEGKKLYIKQNRNTQYDAATIFKLIPEKDFLKMASVGKKQVDEYLRENPEVRQKIMETSQSVYTSPFLAYRTLKGTK